jgi:hypothetical protein
MIKLGVFLIPNNKLKKVINNLKREVKKNFGSQKYLNHLPHCTLCVLYVSNLFLQSVKKKSLKVQYLKEFKIEKTDVFFNDPVTRGNTLIFKIKKNKFLNSMQLQILRLMKKYLIKKKINFINLKMKNNFKKYGYPFVNLNWLPHFTIASITKKKNQKIFINNFKNFKNYIPKQKVKYIYFYEIKKQQHKFLWKTKLV